MSNSTIGNILPDGTVIRYHGTPLYGMVRIYSNIDGSGTIVDTEVLPEVIRTLERIHKQSKEDRVRVGAVAMSRFAMNRRWTPANKVLPPQGESVLVVGRTWDGLTFMQISRLNRDGKWAQDELWQESTIVAWSWLPDIPSEEQVSRWLEEKEPAG